MVPSPSARAWLLAALPAAAVLAVDPGGLSPFGPLKWLLVPAVLLAGTAGVVAARSPDLLPTARRPAVAGAVFLAWVVAAAAFGIDGLYAWTGTPERRFGAVTWLLCALAFFAGQWASPVLSRRIVAVTAGTAGVLGTWATAEALGWRPLDLAGAGSRPVGTLGSSAYLGAAAVLLAPVALGVAGDRARSRGVRIAASVAAATAGVALVGSGARAAWVGAMAAVLVTVGVRGRPVDWSWRRVAAGAGLVGAVVVGLAFATGVAGRVTGALADADGGARGRLDEWRVAARVVAGHPLTGVGPEGYRIAFGGAVDDDYEMAHGRDPLPDRAHSALLDVAVTTGVPGAVAYLALLIAVGRFVLRVLRSGPPATAGVAAGLVGYGAQSLFLFPVAELDPVAWLLAGLVVAQGATAAERVAVRVPRLAPVAATAVAGLALVAGSLDVAADRLARSVLAATAQSRPAGAEVDAAATLGTDLYLSDLSVQGQRVYAIGTGPASVALPGPGAGDLFVGWSDDGGRSFQRQKLPVDMAAIGMGASRVWVGDTEVVAGPNGVVAVAQVGALLNVRALLPAGVTAPNGWVTTATGVDLLGAGAPAACPTPQPRGDVSERIAPDAKGPSESGPGEVQPTWCAGPDGEPTSLIAPQEGRGVLTSYTWADLGVAGELLGAVRGQPIGFFAPPGSTRFERVDLPPTGRPGGPVLLEAGDQGFEMVLTEMVADRVVPGRVNITVLRSDDGRSWSALGTNQADAQWITAAGRLDGRLTLVGSSDSGAKVSSRSDTGTWTTTDLSGVVGAGVPGRTHVVSAGIGPLGIAAVVVTVEEGGPDAGPGRRQPVMSLLTSRDGRTWSNERLADLVGQPVGSVSRVVVDDRRIVVAAHPARPDRRQDEPPTPSTQVLLVGTPE